MIAAAANAQEPATATEADTGATSAAPEGTRSRPMEEGTNSPTSSTKQGRIFGILPTYRSVDAKNGTISPLTTKGKFKLATQDSFDWSSILIAGYYAGIAQATGQYKEWGGGGKGFGKRFAAGYTDNAIGNYLSEAIFPSAFHEDPRYFRKGSGGKWGRMGYAVSRVLITRTDSGGSQVNISELAGNAVAAGISTAYYPASVRNVPDVMGKFAAQVGTDAVFNVLKEFWPDWHDKFFRK